MGQPSVTVEFKTTAATAIQRGDKGIVALILREETEKAQTFSLYSVDEIPPDLSEENRAYIQDAFIGADKCPNKVIVYAMGLDDTFISAYAYLQTQRWDYLAGPWDMTAEEATTMSVWIKNKWGQDYVYRAVLPDTPADHEAIINFSAKDIQVGSATHTAARYCARIAGIIAGTPFVRSATYQPLPEVTDITRLTREQADTAAEEGKLVLLHDGKRVKLGRAITSLVTTTKEKGEPFQKIKLVDQIALIKNDLRSTIDNSYIGKFSNSYENKCLLISAIKGYFEQLELDGLLAQGQTTVGIDVARQRNYLLSRGVDVNAMTEQQIKEANTGSEVFIAVRIAMLDAIEDVYVYINI